MVVLKDFQEDPDWICKRLSFDVTPKQVKTAIETLIHLGLLKRTDDGMLVQSVSTIDTDHTINDEGLKRFHEQMLDHAKAAVRAYQSKKQRFIAGYTLAFNENTVEKAHELIEKFRMDMLNLAESDETRDQVFQFEVAFFSLTKPIVSKEEIESQTEGNQKGSPSENIQH